MSTSFLMYGAVIGVVFIGFIATMRIGSSRENREGNPDYDKNSVPNWIRLTVIYAFATVVFIGILIWIMRL
jgi:heme/copper-type cytochrome/quinol oxidase subunit 2